MSIQILLALSGGGFRATIFHLGVIRWLRDNKVGDERLLKCVKAVAAVSGGSINAAHLTLKWESYTHDHDDRYKECEDEIRILTEAGLRNRLFRRAFWYRMFRRLWIMRSHSLTERLADYYCTYLYGKKNLNDLSVEVNARNAPFPMLMTTSLNQPTDLCYFSPEGFKRFGKSNHPEQHVKCDACRVGQAVAASSAFPFLFPPMEFSSTSLNMRASDFGTPDIHYLTDGGVFENLGLTALLRYRDSHALSDSAVIILSNAGRQIDWDFRTPYSRRMALSLLRSSEIAQYWSEQHLLRQAPDGTKMIKIWDNVPTVKGNPPQPTGAPPSQIQSMAARIRTDFDYFSKLEWELLFDHGYALAEQSLHSLLSSSPPVLGGAL